MILVQVDPRTVELVKRWILDYGNTQASTYGPITDIDQLAQILLKDVAQAIARPASNEGAAMRTLLSIHGYG